MKTSQEYVDDEGLKCPKCGSKELVADDLEHNDRTTVFQNTDCTSCGAYWTEVFKLAGYSNFHEKDPDE